MESLHFTADEIAGWFIEFNQQFVESEEAELISPMKLQKLLYYAQGAFLAIDNTALFDDEIEVWEHGPVIPAIYRKYKVYSAGGIDRNAAQAHRAFDKHTEAMLYGIYEKYGKYSASQLRNMTHLEPPYIDASKAGENSVISKESIKAYFAGDVYKKWIDGTLFDDIPVEEIP